MTGKVSRNGMQVSSFLPLPPCNMGGIDTLIMARGVKVVKMGAGPCSFFRTVTVTVSVIFVTGVLKSLAGNARIVVW